LLGDTNTISTDLTRFSFKLFSRAQRSMLSISAAHNSTLMAGITRYVSSAYLCMELPGVTGWRSEAVTTYEAGPIPDPCMMLAMIFRNSETSVPNLVQCEWSRKNE